MMTCRGPAGGQRRQGWARNIAGLRAEVEAQKDRAAAARWRTSKTCASAFELSATMQDLRVTDLPATLLTVADNLNLALAAFPRARAKSDDSESGAGRRGGHGTELAAALGPWRQTDRG